MTDRPIIFSAAMIAALLAGRKTQSRRLATSPLRKCQPGDRLYIRERCWILGLWRKDGINKAGRQRWRFVAAPDHLVTFDPKHPQIARAGTDREATFYWSRPSIHMPRWASRLSAIVGEVRFQQLLQIDEIDAVAEGIETSAAGFEKHGVYCCVLPDGKRHFEFSAYALYAKLWDALHGAGAWAANPAVLALTFTVHHANIDALSAAA